MGLQREKISNTPTVDLRVDVTFMDGTEGDFTGVFKRISQAEVDEMLGVAPPVNDPDAEPAAWSNSDVVERVLVGVRGISENGQELPADEQLKWVKATPECVTGVVLAFFKAMQRARPGGKTSRSRPSRG